MLTSWEKAEILIENLYCAPYPGNIQEAVNQGIKFLMCGEDEGSKNHERLCDFQKDGKYIYEALLKQGLDLDKANNLHWWTFMAHFAEIPASTFSRIVYLRMQSNHGKLTKDERAECERIGWHIIDLDGLTSGEREAYDEYVFGVE